MCDKSHLHIHYMINYTIFDVLNLVDGCAKHREALVNKYIL
jgi:hypothetical protein